ncbi:unnamed protein product [Symbiodinium sp. CCMP2592]|nr:unnamed protein product [Symbiodinium sp. CCMP2592]
MSQPPCGAGMAAALGADDARAQGLHSHCEAADLNSKQPSHVQKVGSATLLGNLCAWRPGIGYLGWGGCSPASALELEQATLQWLLLRFCKTTWTKGKVFAYGVSLQNFVQSYGELKLVAKGSVIQCMDAAAAINGHYSRLEALLQRYSLTAVAADERASANLNYIYIFDDDDKQRADFHV